jgi:pimeloyl-ACP methyl ester carboxylesterase
VRPRNPEPFVVHDGLAVYRFGSGPPVLFMPGPHRFQRPGDPSADALIAGLTELRREVVTFDPPGSGFSTRQADLGMYEMHECADEALEASGVSGPVVAVGHSMGGLAALAYALERPERVARLILVGTGTGGPAYYGAPGALWNRTHPAFWAMAGLGILHIVIPRLGPQKLMNNFIDRHSVHRPESAEPLTERIELCDWLRPRSGRTDWHRIALKLDYSRRLGEIGVPTLILCGRHDPQFPPTASLELAAAIGGSRLAFFSGSGHYPFLEEPERFWRVVAAFLSDRPV